MSSDTQLAALLLSNQLTRLDVAPLKAREFWGLVDRTDALGIDVGALLTDATVRAQVAEGDVSEQRLTGLLDATRAFAFEIERLGEGGITLLSGLDDRFPVLLRDRMQHRCPPHLFAAGATDALLHRRLAIAADAIDEVTEPIVRQAVAAAVVADWATVVGAPGQSGHGAGPAIDAVVLDEAGACGSTPIVVVADGINRAARSPDVRKLVQQQAFCLVSPFVPDTTASAATSRARDAVVQAMADRTFVVACADGTGPTWATALASVEREPASVLSFTGPGSRPGNAALVGMGAVDIDHIDTLHDHLS
ncbi:MAG: DNA-processing protein DprA [Actinomycetota bacterium]|jgi:predicted Rossmann fold nucleotide-binding protein DprA/Smf involved in DNA uptake|uniref:DNA-processing protein DprA n=1 Tax=uncultured Ilumatobacter sp. TaxID=879968 RepID=UPI00374F382A|nr:DNA-processing protein DprA [Actinomycetota bacterium]